MTLISFIAYADDLFSINCHKSFTFSWAAFIKQSKIIFDYDSKFYVCAIPLKALSFKNKFFYLGMYLIPNAEYSNHLWWVLIYLTSNQLHSNPSKSCSYLKPIYYPNIIISLFWESFMQEISERSTWRWAGLSRLCCTYRTTSHQVRFMRACMMAEWDCRACDELYPWWLSDVSRRTAREYFDWWLHLMAVL